MDRERNKIRPEGDFKGRYACLLKRRGIRTFRHIFQAVPQQVIR